MNTDLTEAQAEFLASGCLKCAVKAAVTVALLKAAEVARNALGGRAGSSAAADVHALIPADHMQAVRELIFAGVGHGWSHGGRVSRIDDDMGWEIVDRILAEKGTERSEEKFVKDSEDWDSGKLGADLSHAKLAPRETVESLIASLTNEHDQRMRECRRQVLLELADYIDLYENHLDGDELRRMAASDKGGNER
jgi:hypothetical protein